MLPEVPYLMPRYNIAPSQDIAVVRYVTKDRQLRLDMFRWGLIPHWAKDKKIGSKMINARAETITEKPSFKAAFKKRRCLIAAGGFYEWHHHRGAKTPYYIQLKEESICGFAGLWESWAGPDGDLIQSCTIITTVANKLVRPIHERMPVIIHPENYGSWLGPLNENKALVQLLRPFPAEEMIAYQVSSKVNNPEHDTPDCLRETRATTLF